MKDTIKSYINMTCTMFVFILILMSVYRVLWGIDLDFGTYVICTACVYYLAYRTLKRDVTVKQAKTSISNFSTGISVLLAIISAMCILFSLSLMYTPMYDKVEYVREVLSVSKLPWYLQLAPSYVLRGLYDSHGKLSIVLSQVCVEAVVSAAFLFMGCMFFQPVVQYLRYKQILKHRSF